MTQVSIIASIAQIIDINMIKVNEQKFRGMLVAQVFMTIICLAWENVIQLGSL